MYLNRFFMPILCKRKLNFKATNSLCGKEFKTLPFRQTHAFNLELNSPKYKLKIAQINGHQLRILIS